MPDTATLTLSDFLLARIAEDERHARAARDRVPLIYNDAALRDLGIGIAQAGHIARHDPARVLAECDAKRRIVDWAAGYTDSGGSGYNDGLGMAAQEALALLARPYVDHPDFQDEWR